MSKPAIVLLTGGLDSTTVLAIAKAQGFEPYALSASATASATASSSRPRGASPPRHGVARHVVADIDLRVVRRLGAHRRHRRAEARVGRRPIRRRHPGHLRAGAQHDLPVVRARLRRGRRRHRHLHRRQRPRLLRLPRLPAGVHRGVRDAWPTWPPAPASRAPRITIHTPLIALTKAEIIRSWASTLGVDYRLTWSCYDPDRAVDGVRALRLVPAAAEGLRRGRRGRSRCATRRADRMTYQGQGDLLHAAGRGHPRRPPGRVLPLQPLQPVDRARGGPGTRDLPVLRHRLRRHRRARRRPVRRRRRARGTPSQPRWPEQSDTTTGWSSAPAASRCCSSTPQLVAALHGTGLLRRRRDQRHPDPPTGHRLAVRQPEDRRRTRRHRRRRAEARLPASRRRPRPVRAPRLSTSFRLQPMDGPARREPTPLPPSSTAWSTRGGN